MYFGYIVKRYESNEAVGACPRKSHGISRVDGSEINMGNLNGGQSNVDPNEMLCAVINEADKSLKAVRWAFRSLQWAT